MTRRPSSSRSQLPLLLQLAAIAFACLALLIPLTAYAFAPPDTIGTMEMVLLAFLTLYCITTGSAVAILCRLVSPGGAWEMALVAGDSAAQPTPPVQPSPRPGGRRPSSSANLKAMESPAAEAPEDPRSELDLRFAAPPADSLEAPNPDMSTPEEPASDGNGRLYTAGPPRIADDPDEVVNDIEADLSDVIESCAEEAAPAPSPAIPNRSATRPQEVEQPMSPAVHAGPVARSQDTRRGVSTAAPSRPVERPLDTDQTRLAAAPNRSPQAPPPTAAPNSPAKRPQDAKQGVSRRDSADSAPPTLEAVRRVTPQAARRVETVAPPLLPADARALRELYADIRSYVDLEFWTMALVKSRELISRFPATPEASTLQRNLVFLESRATASGGPPQPRRATAA